MHALPAALAPMGAYRQFIIYKLVPSSSRPGKTDKLPVDFRSGRVASAHDASIWTDAPSAIAAAAQYGTGYGVGFTFTATDPFWFLDIDNAHDGSDWSPLAKALVQALPGVAVEVSSSGKGLHLFGTGTIPAHGCKNTPYGLEFYHTERFAALTGLNAVGSAATDCTHLLPSLVGQFFPPVGPDVGSSDWTDGPCEGWNGPTDDDELLRRAMRSTSKAAAFGGHASFADLFNGTVEILARSYPPDPGSSMAYGESEADLALAQHLAFWTGKDCERIKRLMLRSALVRSKWTERDDYLDKFTIPKAIARQIDVLTDKHPEPVASREGDAPGNLAPPRAKAVTGATFLTVEQQVDLFAGCVYVTDRHQILVPGGVMLKEGQFRVMFGGYSFPMDNANERTSRDAYEAFTQSQAYRSPRADSYTFQPKYPFGHIINEGGTTAVNTYWPIVTPRQVGDLAPFLEHLKKVLPDERDRDILLSYMAAIVQHKGVKFQWAPLIQGVEGNGKTLFTRCVAFAVGARYTYLPKANKIDAVFNDWRYGKIFIGVEDVYVPESRLEVMENLKDMITGERGELEGKGKDKLTLDLCDNYILNSNHKDGIRIHLGGRRYAPFYAPQQTLEDLTRDGMGGDYFPRLYEWLKAGGFAIVSELLHTYPIRDEFNPATKCQRAPDTSSTGAAIDAGRGGVEQEILEAINQGQPGFAGGWVSSIMLDRLLERLNAARRIPLNKRKELLLSVGYIQHPGLTDGRVNNLITPDMGKPKLYVKQGHPAQYLQGPAAIAHAYTLAQDTTAKSVTVNGN
jgi:hypothetical protein